jgi:hypothetical protein
MNFCTNCGKKVKEGVKFCTNCGAKLDLTYANINNTKKKNNDFRVSNKLFLVFFFVIIFFMGVIIISSYLNQQKLISENNIKAVEIRLLQEQENKNFIEEQRRIENNNLLIEKHNKEIELEQLSKDKANSEYLHELEMSQKENEKLEIANELSEVNNQLIDVKNDLFHKSEELKEALPYMERVNRGRNLNKFYPLLSDYKEYATPIILDYLNLNEPFNPTSDNELWERGRLVYQWLRENYQYCGDKGLRVGNTFYEFQFYSPDELLFSDNHRCGDCDDFATLFAGFMYASGVSEDKVWVTVGKVGAGGHAWNWLVLDDTTYRIDGVCTYIVEYPDISSKRNVDCFDKYEPSSRMNPNRIVEI